MKRLITINGKNTLVYDCDDFKTLINENMGLEAGKYFEDLFTDFKTRLIDKMEEVIDDFFNEIL